MVCSSHFFALALSLHSVCGFLFELKKDVLLYARNETERQRLKMGSYAKRSNCFVARSFFCLISCIICVFVRFQLRSLSLGHFGFVFSLDFFTISFKCPSFKPSLFTRRRQMQNAFLFYKFSAVLFLCILDENNFLTAE